MSNIADEQISMKYKKDFATNSSKSKGWPVDASAIPKDPAMGDIKAKGVSFMNSGQGNLLFERKD